MEKKLPKGWVEKELQCIVEKMTNGSSLKQLDFEFENSLPISRIETISNETIDLTKVKYVKADDKDIEKYKLLKGDILLSHINSDKHLGKTAIFNLDRTLLHGINLLLIRSKKDYNSFLLNYYFKHLRLSGKFIEVAQRSVNQSSINQKKLNDFKIIVPPLPEQERIVAKLDTLFAHLEQAKKGLEKIPVLLKQFRQAVLTQAVTGKLTKCKVEIKKLNELIVDVKYGTSKKSEYEIEGTPIFRIPNIDEGEIKDFDLKYSILEDKEFEQLKLMENDVLIIRSNGSLNLVGRSAIIRKKHENYCYAGYLIRLRPNTSIIGDYLNYSLQSDFLRNQIVNTAHSSSGVNNINSQEIKDLLISIPTITEQDEIVRRLQALFAIADAIEKKYKSLKEKIDNLPQAILAKAFRGEL
jgi:type I restriction enzyme S subunit